MTSWRHCLTKVPELLNCSKDSIFDAFMKCAELNLFPGQASGEAYILPYKGKAQFQLGYQGFITLLYRAGIQAITSHIIFANDEFEYEEGVNSKLIHKPKIFDANRGEPIGAYAVATYNGTKQFCVLSRETILKFKEFSQSKGSQYSPWNGTQDPEKWMWRKVCIKQLSKTLPKNDYLVQALEEDNKDSDLGLPASEKAHELMQNITPITE